MSKFQTDKKKKRVRNMEKKNYMNMSCEFNGMMMNNRVKTEELYSTDQSGFLRKSDMEEESMAREFEVRRKDSEKLGMVESFVFPMGEESVAIARAATKTKENNKRKEITTQEKDYDGYGNAIICKLSKIRKVAVQKYKGKTLVSIREYHEKDGKQYPCPKGISLTGEQWAVFRTAVPSIEEAILKIGSKLG